MYIIFIIFTCQLYTEVEVPARLSLCKKADFTLRIESEITGR